MTKEGVFITLEGIDFSGKSTQADYILARLKDGGLDVLFLREPGGTELSERVRSILLSRKEIDICPKSELFLFLAARAQIVEEVIIPAINAGRIVLCDRFYDSTYAYQGFARGLGLESVEPLNVMATSGLKPDLTILYDLPVSEARKRGAGFLSDHDRLENERVEFHERVRDGYHRLARREPERIKLVDASGQPQDVWKLTWEILGPFLENRGFAVSG